MLVIGTGIPYRYACRMQIASRSAKSDLNCACSPILHVHVANMATAKGKGGGKQKDKEAPSAEQIVAKFQQMRNEQRAIVSKIAELETDRGEHK